MKTKEIKLRDLNPEKFIEKKIAEIKAAAGDGIVINALSGGVSSLVVTMLGHLALGGKMKTFHIESGLRKKRVAEEIAAIFKPCGIQVEVIDAKDIFFEALKNLKNPEEKQEAIVRVFYKNIFSYLICGIRAKGLLQGTDLSDVKEAIIGRKHRRNVFAPLGIDPEKEFGYQIIEPLLQLEEESVRVLAKTLGLPESVCNPPAYQNPALDAGIIGEVTPKRVRVVRAATAITEDALASLGNFRYMVILHSDRATGERDGRKIFGHIIQVRSWKNTNARIADPIIAPMEAFLELDRRLREEIPDVVNVTLSLTPKSPPTMEIV